MNRFEMIRRTLMWESVAAAARAKAAKLRDDLTADAQAEYAEQGTAPTWRLPDIGTVTLPVSKETVYVADEAALLDWVKASNPDEVEVSYRVRPAFLASLLETTVPHDGAVIDPEGTVVPGLAVREGGRPGSLAFRPSSAAKAVAQAGAQQLVELLEPTIDGPIVLAEGGTSAA